MYIMEIREVYYYKKKNQTSILLYFIRLDVDKWDFGHTNCNHHFNTITTAL